MVVVERKIKEGWKGGRWFISFITSLKLFTRYYFIFGNKWVGLVGYYVRWWVFVGRSVGWALVDGKKCVLWKEFGSTSSFIHGCRRLPLRSRLYDESFSAF